MNVLLVDDQPSVIASLVTVIPWHSLDIHSVFTAGSAREAKQVFASKQVDILISDIEMPGEDGLALLSWVRESGFDCECIFLTAHADFFYAKRAISLDVLDYLVQPARDEDIIRTVKKALDKRRAKNDQKEGLKYQTHDYAVRNAAAKAIFESWPTARECVTDTELLPIHLKRLQEIVPFASASSTCVMLLNHIRSWQKLPMDASGILSRYRRLLDHDLETISHGQISWFVDQNLFYTALLLPAHAGDPLPYLKQLYSDVSIEIGCSMRTFTCQCSLDKLREAIDLLRQSDETFSSSHPSHEICFQSLTLPAASWEVSPSEERLSLYMKKIRAFIEGHMDEPITRTQIAEALYLTPSYVSHVIKETENMSCKELVNNIKMDYARSMLRTSRLSIGDISEKCGFNSFAYFSKVYKETFGITPSQERE
ncbi:MAG: response regulator [Lachnospiraceae bacterium]|nr:response regulator [Lachnospiraceae bacterium]